MLNSLDLLIIVFMGLTAASVLSSILMFVLKNRTAQRICLYLSAALGLFAAYGGIMIGFPYFMGQFFAAVIFGLASVAAVVLERLSRGDEKLFLIARIAAAASLVLGICNTFIF
ncbi:MAG: hypothetical protein E7623_02925 [Ruminococcaceae bacterium]|nr:hypothetical protein [Oscillospiraceae bacterium]